MNYEIISIIPQDKLLEELTCPICLSIFNEPVLVFPNQHIFCKKCLESCLKTSNKLFPTCPLCNSEITSIIKPQFINNILSSIQMKCAIKYKDKICDFKGNVIDYYDHIKTCELLLEVKKENLKEIAKNMIDILDKEINPHLKKEHLSIFENYVKNWDWLVDKNEDWKWWWWSDKEWWGNKSCVECNNLWHKYEDEIQVFENKRISLLNSAV